MLDLKREAIKLGLGIVYIISLIIVIRHLHLQWWQVALLILGTSTLLRFIIERHLPPLKSFIKSGIVIFLVVAFNHLVSPHGLTGFLIVCFVTAGYILYSRRKQFIKVKHHIESMLWGRPLNEFEKGKVPKIKIVR